MLYRLLTKYFPKKFVIFCFVGLSSSIIDISILYALVEFVHAPMVAALMLAHVAGSINGFFLNRIITFKSKSKKIKTQYALFLGVTLIGLCLTLILMHFLISTFSMYYIYAKMITIVLVTGWNFTASTFFVFHKKTEAEQIA